MSNQLIEKKWQIRTVVELFMMVALSGLYFLSLKFIATHEVLSLFFDSVNTKPIGAYSLSLTSFVELYYSIQNYTYGALQLWFLDWSHTFFIVVTFIFSLYMLFLVIMLFMEQDKKIVIASRIVIPAVIFGIAGAPMVYGGIVPTRTLVVGASIGCIFLLAGLFHLFSYAINKTVGEWALIILAIVVLLAGNVRLSTAAFNAHLELEFVRKHLSATSPESLSQGIMIQQPKYSNTIIGMPVRGDFTLMATSPTGMQGLPRGLLKEMGLNYRNIPIQYQLNQSEFRFYAVKPKNVQFKEIFMSDVGLGFSNNRTVHSECQCSGSQFVVDLPRVAVYSNITNVSSYSILKVFDNSLHSFWETRFEGHPVTLDFEYNQPTKLYSYEFYCGIHGRDSTDRMPMSWKVLASSDRSTWVTLDTHENVKPWNQDEKRLFKINAQQPYLYYKFVFEKTASAMIRLYEINFDTESMSNIVRRNINQEKLNKSCNIDVN